MQHISTSTKTDLSTPSPYDEEYSTEPVAVGIDISGSRLMTEYELYDDTCVLGVGAYTQHPEDVAAFLEVYRSGVISSVPFRLGAD